MTDSLPHSGCVGPTNKDRGDKKANRYGALADTIIAVNPAWELRDGQVRANSDRIQHQHAMSQGRGTNDRSFESIPESSTPV